MVEQLDRDIAPYTKNAKITNNLVIQRLKKTFTILNDHITNFFIQGFGIDGITYENIEEVYNPLRTGLGSLQATHEFLL